MTKMFERSGRRSDSGSGRGGDCRWAEPLLSCSRDGAITEEEEAKLARHLARCGTCASFLAELYEVEGAVQEAFRCDPEPRGWQKIAAFIDAGDAAASGSGRYGRPSQSARLGNPLGHPIARIAAAVLVLAGAFVAVRGFYPALFRDTPARVESDQPVPPVAGLPVAEPASPRPEIAAPLGPERPADLHEDAGETPADRSQKRDVEKDDGSR